MNIGSLSSGLCCSSTGTRKFDRLGPNSPILWRIKLLDRGRCDSGRRFCCCKMAATVLYTAVPGLGKEQWGGGGNWAERGGEQRATSWQQKGLDLAEMTHTRSHPVFLKPPCPLFPPRLDGYRAGRGLRRPIGDRRFMRGGVRENNSPFPFRSLLISRRL